MNLVMMKITLLTTLVHNHSACEDLCIAKNIIHFTKSKSKYEILESIMSTKML